MYLLRLYIRRFVMTIVYDDLLWILLWWRFGWVVENFVWKPARQASTTDPSSWHLVRFILYSFPRSGFGNRRLGKTPLQPRPRWEVREGTDTWSEWYNLSGVIQHEWFGSTSGSYTEEIGWGLRNCLELFWFEKKFVLNYFGLKISMLNL